MLGRRGMRRVHLVDAEAEPGGILRWIPELPGLREWARVVDYRVASSPGCQRRAHSGHVPEAGDVAEYGADLVVVATGAAWATDGLNGHTMKPIPGADAALPHVLTPDQIMVGGKPVAETALVYDCDGYFMGVSLAEKLARDGVRVSPTSPRTPACAPFMHETGEAPDMLRLLRRLGVALVPSRIVERIEPGRATSVDSFFGDDPVTHEVPASVVLVTQRVSSDGLFRQLRAERDGGLYRIGDCVAPRLLADAIFDGHRLAREIDSPDPAASAALRARAPARRERDRRRLRPRSATALHARVTGGSDIVRLDRLSAPEWQALEQVTFMLPIGSTEQHGAHLPVGTDTAIAVAVCEGGMRRRGRPRARARSAVRRLGPPQAPAGRRRLGRSPPASPPTCVRWSWTWSTRREAGRSSS